MLNGPGRKDSLTPLGEVLNRALARLGLERNLDDYRIWQAWDEVVGSTIARNAQPVRLKGKRLVVAVRNASWMHELSMLSRQLVERCNDWMGREVITEIFLVVGKVEQPTNTPKTDGRQQAGAASSAAQSTSVGQSTEAACDPPPGMSAPGLSADAVAAFERLWRASRRRQQDNDS